MVTKGLDANEDTALFEALRHSKRCNSVSKNEIN